MDQNARTPASPTLRRRHARYTGKKQASPTRGCPAGRPSRDPAGIAAPCTASGMEARRAETGGSYAASICVGLGSRQPGPSDARHDAINERGWGTPGDAQMACAGKISTAHWWGAVT